MRLVSFQKSHPSVLILVLLVKIFAVSSTLSFLASSTEIGPDIRHTAFYSSDVVEHLTWGGRNLPISLALALGTNNIFSLRILCYKAIFSIGASEATRLTASQCCAKRIVNGLASWIVFLVVLVLHFLAIASYEFDIADPNVFSYYDRIAPVLTYTSVSW